jgi:hypothetical protein
MVKIAAAIATRTGGAIANMRAIGTATKVIVATSTTATLIEQTTGGFRLRGSSKHKAQANLQLLHPSLQHQAQQSRSR